MGQTTGTINAQLRTSPAISRGGLAVAKLAGVGLKLRLNCECRMAFFSLGQICQLPGELD